MQRQLEVEQLAFDVAQLKVKQSLFATPTHSPGYDRNHRRYWSFGSMGGLNGTARLFVEDADSHSLFCLDTAAVSK